MVVKQTQEGNYSAERYAGTIRVGQVWADCWDLKDECGVMREKGECSRQEDKHIQGSGKGKDLLFQGL